VGPVTPVGPTALIPRPRLPGAQQRVDAPMIGFAPSIAHECRAAELAGARAILVRDDRLDALTLAGAALGATASITIIVAARLRAMHPFVCARALTTLDHLSRGRIALLADEAGLTDEECVEYIAAVDALWQSWEPGAEIRNPQTGAFADAGLVHPVDFDGRHYRSRGPLNLPHAPQENLRVWASPESALATRADVVLDAEMWGRITGDDRRLVVVTHEAMPA
jgi:alkanesulfonate monooxygenase SsuD/methylene tetrahydromethanopterin reductase-like flavin-dependent oxidoreductase (luciferase family)